ncbi:hypothetical protein [Alphaentomopoxvirus acuprea]|uniref:Uncharacterized protein n=1 Tax=Alphaentomopoxvirus acuprea TaxID=62099 RepID=W6JKW7_9POXV|nr:hypothetical protein BA82_gp080 [Anomala cuprea entomopoxvirus]BAO49440.1 hypothetical protein [Anomala cuprea entomopoxvirus]
MDTLIDKLDIDNVRKTNLKDLRNFIIHITYSEQTKYNIDLSIGINLIMIIDAINYSSDGNEKEIQKEHLYKNICKYISLKKY